MSYEFIQFRGKEIFSIDYTKCKGNTDALNLLNETAEVLKNHEGKALILINYEGQHGTREYMKRAKEISAETFHKVEKRAVLGIHGLKKILLQGFNKVAKDKAYPFDSREEALIFLTKASEKS